MLEGHATFLAAARIAPGERLRRVAYVPALPICLITVLAGVLRFAHVEQVSPNLFYDAAVSSMSVSLHNFFFGAFDPSASLSIDKPPLDLWLQVASTKLFGWSQFALRLPEALAGTLSVPLLYGAVRRAVSRPAAIAAAAALALLPESVLTARSDTMDSLMMLLVIAALWFAVRAASSSSGARRRIVLAGVALGLAFEVKLMEALIAAPAIALIYVLAGRGSARRKTLELGKAAVAMVAVGLAWPLVVSLLPGHHPWPVGSTDGSVWNAMFVFNGFGRVGTGTTGPPGGPGPFRLLVSTGWHFDVLFGCALVAAVAIGSAAAAHVLHREGWRATLTRRALPQAFAIAVAIWIVFALLVFDLMSKVHARYLEALAPAIAAAIGCGAAALAGLRDREDPRLQPAVLASALALACVCAYTVGLEPTSGWGVGALVLSATGAALIVRSGERYTREARWLLAGVIVAAASIFPVHETAALLRTNANDSLGLATLSKPDAAALSRFLSVNAAGTRYELAVDEPTQIAPLLILDRRPILALNSFGASRLTTRKALRLAAQAGLVRYALVAQRCRHTSTDAASCTPAARWVRRHGTDVSSFAGVHGNSRLYLLPGTVAS